MTTSRPGPQDSARESLPGISATGRLVTMTATVIYRAEDGKIDEKWSDMDVLGFLQQLGVPPKA